MYFKKNVCNMNHEKSKDKKKRVSDVSCKGNLLRLGFVLLKSRALSAGWHNGTGKKENPPQKKTSIQNPSIKREATDGPVRVVNVFGKNPVCVKMMEHIKVDKIEV